VNLLSPGLKRGILHSVQIGASGSLEGSSRTSLFLGNLGTGKTWGRTECSRDKGNVPSVPRFTHSPKTKSFSRGVRPAPSKIESWGGRPYGVENAYAFPKLSSPQTPPPLPTLIETSPGVGPIHSNDPFSKRKINWERIPQTPFPPAWI